MTWLQLMKPITKSAKQIVYPSTIPSIVREAFRLAEEERPGPVHLELPEDIAEQIATDVHLFERSKCPSARLRYLYDRPSRNMICDAQRPLLLIGAGANRKRIIEVLQTFVEKTGIPFFNTQMGKGCHWRLSPFVPGNRGPLGG